jgi:hypothetical protein
MRHSLWAMLVGAVMLLASASSARAQVVTNSSADPARVPVITNSVVEGAPGISPYYAAPGSYATSWGVPSFGMPRTYTVFSSPYGQGYGYGYYPYVYWPGYYNYRVWRPGVAMPGYFYGGAYSRRCLRLTLHSPAALWIRLGIMRLGSALVRGTPIDPRVRTHIPDVGPGRV